MSTSSPVPGYRFPKWAVAYQSVCHAVAGSPSIARWARSLWSPRPPLGLNAATLAGVSVRTALPGVAGVSGLAGVAGAVGLGAGGACVPTATGGWVAGCAVAGGVPLVVLNWPAMRLYAAIPSHTSASAAIQLSRSRLRFLAG